MTETNERTEVQAPWLRTLTAFRGDEGVPEGAREIQAAVDEALSYMDRLRADLRNARHWVPIEIPWRSVQAGDVILAPPSSDAPAGTPHMILRSAAVRDVQWVQAVGGGEVEPRNAKRDASATITVLYPYEMAVALGLLDEGGVTA